MAKPKKPLKEQIAASICAIREQFNAKIKRTAPQN